MDNRINELKAILVENQELCTSLAKTIDAMSLEKASTVQAARATLALLMQRLKPERVSDDVKLNLNWQVAISLSSMITSNQSTAAYNRSAHSIVISRTYWKNIEADERYEVIIHELVHTVQHAFGENNATYDNDAEAYAISEYLVDMKFPRMKKVEA